MNVARSGIRSAASALVVLLASSLTVWCQLRPPAVPNPDPAVQAVLAAEAGEIRRLLETAVNRGATATDRVNAINRLGGIYFDHFLANAEPLVQDPVAEVAKAAIAQLGAQIAMLHTSHDGAHASHAAGTAPSHSAYVVGESLRLLRLGMEHPDPVARDEAAAILTSRGDLQALARIQARIESGQMSVPDGVKYMSLAPLNVAAPYIAVHLTSSDVAARRAAVIPLSYLPAYTVAVRSMVAGPNSDETVIRAALPGLSVTDKDFPTYASRIVENKALARETREIAVESSVRFALKSETSGPAARDLATALAAAAEELQSERARAAVRDLKAKHNYE